MNCSSHAQVLLAFEKAFVEAGEQGARLAAEKAAKLGLTVTYSDGTNLVEARPDGGLRIVKALDRPRSHHDLDESKLSLLANAFELREIAD